MCKTLHNGEYIEEDIIFTIKVYYSLYIIYRYLAAYFLADFITGIGHWLTDTYFNKNFKLFLYLGSYGKKADEIIKKNSCHHIYLKEFKQNWFNNITFAMCGLLVNFIINYYFKWTFDMSNIFMWSLICCTNAIHRSHYQSYIDKPFIILVLQYFRLIQNGEHYITNKNQNSNYCIITPYLNYFLDKYRFWRILEKIIEKITGILSRIYKEYKKDNNNDNNEEIEKDEQDYQQVVHSLEKSCKNK